jgi:uncharacterized protein HemY
LDEAKPNTVCALAAVHWALDHLEEADRLYQRSISLRALKAHIRYAEFLEEARGDLAAAEAELWAAKDNDEPGWGYALGSVLLKREKHEEAAQVLQLAAEWGDRAAKELLEEEFEVVDNDP